MHIHTMQRRYSEWIIQAKRTIVHVLEDLPSFKPPLDHLLELLPRLQARYYSISSSHKVKRVITDVRLGDTDGSSGCGKGGSVVRFFFLFLKGCATSIRA